MRGVILWTVAVMGEQHGFFRRVQESLGCEYACSLIEGCVQQEGSVCENGMCTEIRRSKEGGYCINCDGEEEEALSCKEAMQGLAASFLEDEDGVFNFIPSGLL